MNVRFLTPRWESAYEVYLKEGENTLFYHSNGFRKFLKRLLPVEDHYLLALKEEKIVGALPAVLYHSSIGTCLNSLAFFGSNGGVVEFNGDEVVRQLLINEFFRLGKSSHCLSATIISSPFADCPELNGGYDYLDKRIGQISDIRILCGNQAINRIDCFDSFTRRMIRKAIKNSVRAEVNNQNDAFDFLRETHYENMEAIKGKKKPEAFFKLVTDHFNEGQDYNLWVAYKGYQPVAALLLFYFNRTVEYYIPAIVKEYRSIQPLSLLIFEAMSEAAKRGYLYWNWGGTHWSQGGVYRFKKQWNAIDMPYYYYIRVYDDRLFTRSEEEIKREVPFGYILPFSNLNN